MAVPGEVRFHPATGTYSLQPIPGTLQNPTMNLYDLLTRKDKNLAASPNVARTKGTFFGETWRGLALPPGAEFRLFDVGRFYPLRSWPDFCGWYAALSASTPDFEVSFVRNGGEEVLGRRVYTRQSGVVPVNLPWPLDARSPAESMDLVGRAVGKGGEDPLFLAVHRALSRSVLLNAAKGVGVEIGPGQRPQVLPGPDVKVSYVEQMPPDEWNRLYNTHGKYPVNPELWSHYVIGEASSLPVEDASLDFIFASHVFEHLANPFGHLLRWKEKLKPGGLILCVVPDLCGTKDARQVPSGMSEWMREWKDDLWDPDLAHYKRHMAVAMPDQDPQVMLEQRRSIHVHYFTNDNMAELLSFATRELGFAWFKIEHTANHKDFHFILANAG